MSRHLDNCPDLTNIRLCRSKLTEEILLNPVRCMLFAIGALGAALLPSWAIAQYPTKPVRIVVPFQPGAVPDTLARTVAERLTRGLGQPVVVDNRPGAGGNIGAEIVANAPGDGYTLMLATSSHASNPSLFRKVNYDPVKDFAAITMVARIPGVLVVPANSPAQSVRELIALAKSKPGALTFASGGNGSQAHFAGEMFKSAAGIDILHIPYKGAPEIMASLLSDQTSMGFPTLPTALPQIKAGKVRALAVTSLTRNPQLPEVPTMREAMDHGFDLNAWFGIVAPASVSPQIIARLNTEIVKILNDPEVRNKLGADGSEVVTMTPQEFAALIKTDVAVWADIVKASGVKLD